MSYFAEINNDGIVQRVIVAEQDFIDSGAVGDCFNWIETSRNGNFRKNYAGTGHTYDKTKDAFIPPKTFPSWVLVESTCQWEAPSAYPNDGKEHRWDEDNTEWKELY